MPASPSIFATKGDAPSIRPAGSAPAVESALIRLALGIVLLVLIAKLFLVAHGYLELGQEGDEGARINVAARLALEGWGDVLAFPFEKWTSIHPPGDIALRAIVLKLASGIAPNATPVTIAMMLSAVLSAIGAALLIDAARRLGGGFAALALSILLAVSWNFHNPSLSGMGEGSVIPFFALQIWLLVRGLLERSQRLVLWSAVATLLASTFRPEPVFFLPGLCLALWYAMGFVTAVLYGAIASSYLVVKTAYVALLSPDALSILNLSKFYHSFRGVPLMEFDRSGFGSSLLHDPFRWAFAALLVVALIGLMLPRGSDHDRDANRRTFTVAVILLGVAGYLALTVTSVVTGRTANASVRIAYLPSYALALAASVGISRLFTLAIGERWTELELNLLGLSQQTRIVAVALLSLLTVGGVALEARHIAKKGTTRGPQNALAIRDWLLANAAPDDGIVLDRIYNRENWMIAYLANRPKVCAYVSCDPPLAPEPATDPKEDCGPGRRFCIYHRMVHAFIRSKRPRWFVSHTGKFSQDWLKIQEGVFGPRGLVLWSFIYPYSQPLGAAVPSAIASPSSDRTTSPAPAVKEKDATFVERRVSLPDSFAFVLTPRHSTGQLVIYEASYR